MTPAPALELENIRKSFGPVHAVRGADFSLRAGEVHALVGENGAGKSTLMHIAYGMMAPDAGGIRVNGRPVTLRSPRDARALGIGMVHQHFTSIGGLSVQENIELVAGRMDGQTDGRTVQDFLTGISWDRPVRGLSVMERQWLEIGMALATGARILLLDEPTGALAPREVDQVLASIRAMAERGGAVVLITHKLREVFAVADRVTVLRQGAVKLHGPVSDHTEQSLAAAMVGTAEAGGRTGKTGESGGGTGATGQTTVRIGGIELRAGELISVAAVEGNGHRDILRTIAGLRTAPNIEARGAVAFVPEDRTTEGLIPALSITENLVLGLGSDPRWARGRRLDWSAARTRAAELIAEFGIVAPGPDVPVGTLSGGNQQKVVLARALELGPQVLVAENPTRGLDVRTTREMHRRLRDAAAAGVTVIVHSTDLDEVLELGDRVLVVWKGAVTEAPRERSRVGEMMLGVT